MAITFPASPTISQIFTSGNKSWIWDGTTWLAYGASLSPTVLKVDTVNARVGINNQTPSQALDVNGTIINRLGIGYDGFALVGPPSSVGTNAVLMPTTLTAPRTYTLPDATGTVITTGNLSSITSVGTLGSLTVTGDLTVDTNTLRVDSTNNRVGINVTSPTVNLDIVGNQVIRAATLQDGIQLAGRAGGTGSATVKLIPDVLTGNRTLTLPDKTGTVALTSDPGLILVKTQTVGTGVSSVTVTGAFSTDYDNYKITYIGGTCSANADIEMTIGGSATGYYGFLSYGITTLASNQAAVKNNATAFPWVGGGAAGQASHVHVEIMGPFKAAYTKIRNGSYQNDNNYGTMQGEHRVATSYTSFALAVLTGTMTGGTIRVYGYRNS